MQSQQKNSALLIHRSMFFNVNSFHKNKIKQAMISIRVAEMSEMKVINSLNVIWILQWQLYTMKSSQAISRMKMQSVSNIHETVSLYIIWGWWVDNTHCIYTKRVCSKSLVSCPKVGHWDGTPGSFLHLSHDPWWWRHWVYKILDMNSIFAWLIAWKDFTATSWMYHFLHYVRLHPCVFTITN
jgi:hypothetical protein